MTSHVGSEIAIVGMACCYPDARSPRDLWENVLAQRRAFRRIPAERLRLDDYWSAEPGAPDRTYVTKAALIEGYEFDRVAFRVAGATFRSADLVHWLALDIAAQALADAGYPNGEGLPKVTTGVLLGNTLTGEFSRANGMRLRWPYVQRVVDASLAAQGWSLAQRRPFLQNLEAQYKAPFPPITEETLAGGLSNTIAGRICNHFDLKGGGYTVDGACASSLLAITTACTGLLTGDLDVAIAGGVDLSLDPFELVGFAKAGALAADEMRVFDARSDGFWPGEGCGAVVLMRHADAEAQNRRIYASIQGWGVSSDGHGGITRPEVAGQLLALQRAYRRAGFGIETVAYFEGHGTGTAVGDTTELRTLCRARHEQNSRPIPAAIGSIKANIGHTKAAAGVAGLIKAVMALTTQTLPPMTGYQIPHPELSDPKAMLRLLPQAERWPTTAPLRAGVSAMGFGGINTHLVLSHTTSERQKKFTHRERLLQGSAQDQELFLFCAETSSALQEQIEPLLQLVPRLSRAELTDLAATLQRSLGQGPVRAAIVADTPPALTKRLQALQARLDKEMATALDFSGNIFLGNGLSQPRVGFLFPGQGTPVYKDGGALGRRFAGVQALYTNTNFSSNGDIVSTAVAQPAVVTATLAALRVLQSLKIRASVAVGHSLGELCALYWAGVFDEHALLRIARRRGQLMATFGHSPGAMAHIGADDSTVQSLLNRSSQASVTIACLNSPKRTVIAGEVAAVTTVVARAHTMGLHAGMLPVSHAFHSLLMATSAPPLAEYLIMEDFQPPQHSVISTITGDYLTADEDLRALLHHQVTAPVRFREAVTKAAEEVALLIEVGPGQLLSGLVREQLDLPIVAIDAGGGSLQGLLQAAAATFVLGMPIDHAALFTDRFTRPFNLNWQPRFWANPCELVPPLASDPQPDMPTILLPMASTEDDPLSTAPAVEANALSAEEILTLVRQLVADHAELPLATIRDSDRLLSELHLNSISVSQLVAEAARLLDLPSPVAPTEFADVTVAVVAETLAEVLENGASRAVDAEPRLVAGVDSWVRPFTVEWVARPFPPSEAVTALSDWTVVVTAEHPLAGALQQAFANAPGCGIVLCLPPQPDMQTLKILLEGVQTFLSSTEANRFVLIQHTGGAASLARTLYLEERDITTCVVTIPVDPCAIAWVIAEATTAVGYSEVHYDAAGARTEALLRLLPLALPERPLPFSAQDLLLVTGGGKGITAECALSLARATGVRLALLGRTDPGQEPALAANLERMRLAGVNFRYFAVDITQAEAVNGVLQEVERSLGLVTGILHGAASNVPQLLRSLDMAAFQRTLAPKIQGLRNLLAAIKPDQLRLLVTFGSIIARTGLPGEADYGLANEWLVALTEQFQREQRACRCLAIEWSVWSGAGMGDRLGRLDALARQGITPIPLDEGVAMLHRLLAHIHHSGEVLPTSLVVTGRIGGGVMGLPTLRIEQPELPFLRFLEEVRVYYPGVELVVDANLSMDTDPYLADHTFLGERLLPAVIGLEAMAQVAMSLIESEAMPVFENVRFDRPVIVPEHGTVTIRIAALVRSPTQVEIVIRSEESAFQIDHFRALCQFGDSDNGDSDNGGAQPMPSTQQGLPSPLLLDPEVALYGRLLFQQGRFQRIKNYRQIAAKACLAEITSGEHTWFGRYLPPNLLLGDPGARDATIHALQVCVPHLTLLPIAIERFVPLAIPDASAPRFLHARERSAANGTFIYDLEVTNAEGQCIERWQGLHLRAVGGMKVTGPWSPQLFGPYLERALADLLPKAAVRVAIEQAPALTRRQRSAQGFQQILGQAAVIQYRADGKPETMGAQSISAAHAGGISLVVAGREPIGCDLELVVERPEAGWQALLTPARFDLAQRITQEIGENLDVAATRIWSAGECLKKVGAALDTPLLYHSSSKPAAQSLATPLSTIPADWVLLSAGLFRIVTFVVTMDGQPNGSVVAVLG